MRLYRRLPRRSRRDRALTVGVFDGLHRGHERIVRVLLAAARRRGLSAALMTFNDHPHQTLAPALRPLRLATDGQRLARLRVLGLDEVFLLPFTRRLADTPPETFVARVLLERLRMRQMVVGEDFRFGRHGRGDAALLRELGKRRGFSVTVVKPRRLGGRVLSSTRLRAALAGGRVAWARRGLGRPYALHGRVVRGEGRGARIGLPTANLHTEHEIVPAAGVYAVWVRSGARIRPALCHIGPQPTFHRRGPRTIEVHIPGWRGSLYGRSLEVLFLSRLRAVRPFSGAEALRAQVTRDWERARRVWPAGTSFSRIFSGGI